MYAGKYFAMMPARRNKMTKIAIWCRHNGDNIIGIGSDIPWNIPSDVRKYQKIIAGQPLVMGRTTYESIPPETLLQAEVYVLSANREYETANPERHRVMTDIRKFKDFDGNLYICGGAGVYEAFMTLSPKLLPDIVIDCVYDGPLQKLDGVPVHITPCIELLAKKYFKIAEGQTQDNVANHLYVKRGDFVDQSVLRHILSIIEQPN